MVKSDDRSVTPFFLPKISSKKGRFLFCVCFFFQVRLCGFFPVNTMAIQHGKEFIEWIARNTLEAKKDPWLWFSRILWNKLKVPIYSC